MAKAALGPAAFVAVAVLAVGNAGGRILAGVVSDKIGRQMTLFFAFLLQSCDGAGACVSSVTMQSPCCWQSLLIGACYGANLTLFPGSDQGSVRFEIIWS